MTNTRWDPIAYVTLARRGGHVRRFHTLKTLHPNTVAEHSHGVATLCVAMTGGAPSAAILQAALQHDVIECLVGDMPRNAKWEFPELAKVLKGVEHVLEERHGMRVELTSKEQTILHEADMLDLMYYALEERLLGNMHLDRMFRVGFNYLHEKHELTEEGRIILDYIKEEWPGQFEGK